jgi:hypothetical protein
MDPEVVGKGLSRLGQGIAPAIIARAREMGVQLAAEISDREQTSRPGSSSASCGTSPATSSRSSRETPKTSDESGSAKIGLEPDPNCAMLLAQAHASDGLG